MIQSLHKFFMLLIIFIFPLYIFAQDNGNITVGSLITATLNSNPWLSPSGDFAFGFQPIENNTDHFVLSIWFNRIPARTIVWFERSCYPVPRGSTLQLNAAQGLVLTDPRGTTIWNTNDFSGEVVYGYMNNTGNFILFGSNAAWLWQSFSHPADTILPTQTIEIGGMLVSRKTQANYSEGRFYARMIRNGNFVLNTRSIPSNTDFDDEYYSSSTQTSDETNTSNSGYQLMFSEQGSLSITRRNGIHTNLSPISIPPASENYYRATLDFYGLFTQYYHPRNYSGNPGWSVARSWPDNICSSIDGHTGSGACGYNSICRLESNRPVCNCPRGFSLVDPNNPYGDCMPRSLPNCNAGENGSAFDMFKISDTDWPGNDYELINPSSEENCRNACLDDCLCGAAIYRSNQCWKKKLPLSNGKVDITLNVIAFLKFRRGDLTLLSTDVPIQHQQQRNNRTLVLVGSLPLGSLVIVLACLSYFLVRKKKISFLKGEQSTSGSNIRCFTYKELVLATNRFKKELGKGAFGIVYKGVMSDASKTPIAVKKIIRDTQDSDKEFKVEVNVIGQTHHKNLVPLIGYCDKGPNRLLVYEYMSNGTLAEYLFGNSKPNWSQRCLMAHGVARGLTYLHEECSTQIIHCDIKPQNILIDEHYNARISDFGLVKLLGMNQTRTWTNVRGTKGYVAPEWFRNTQVTAKVDVYSFGVVLLEIVSCRKSVESTESEENKVLTDWVWDCYQDNKLDSLVDGDTEALCDATRLERFVKIGIWCVQEDASLRPSMRKVSQMLEGIVQVAIPPCPYTLPITN